MKILEEDLKRHTYHLTLSKVKQSFAFVTENCSREIIEVATIEINEGTNEFRYKIKLSDDFITETTNNWCTRFK
jgi:hypothetical protein